MQIFLNNMVTSINICLHLLAHGKTLPIISYGIDKIDTTKELENKNIITIDTQLDAGPHNLIIEFYNKTNSTPDMAVEIEQISFNNITLDRFKWAGKYYPTYPEPWASEQKDQLSPCLDNATYMGWNGKWILPFYTPIFSWIHGVDFLGWMYGLDENGQLKRIG